MLKYFQNLKKNQFSQKVKFDKANKENRMYMSSGERFVLESKENLTENMEKLDFKVILK